MFASFLAISLILASFLVSAKSQVEFLNNVGEGVLKIVEPLFASILGDIPGGEYLFAKVLFLLILFSIIWVALSMTEFFQEYTWVLVLVSVAVSIIAVRWIGDKGLIDTIIIPSSALAIAITAGIPFIVYAVVVEKGLAGRAPIIRRIAWIFFAVIFIGLWITRYDTISAAPGNEFALWIYPIAAILAIIMAFIDGTIQGWMERNRFSRADAAGRGTAYGHLQQNLNDVHNAYVTNMLGYVGRYPSPGGSGRTGSSAYQADVRYLKRAMKALV